MKVKFRFFLLIISLIICKFAFSQSKNIFGIIDLDDSSKIVHPLLARYLPTYFQFQITDTNNIIFETRNLRLSHYKNDIYRLNASDSSVRPEMTVYRLTDGIKTKIYYTYFSVIDPPITILMSNLKSGSKMKESDLDNAVIAAVLNFDIDLRFKVESFTLVLFLDNKCIVKKVKGGYLEAKHIALLKQLEDGQVFVLKDIMFRMRDGRLSDLPPVLYFLEKE